MLDTGCSIKKWTLAMLFPFIEHPASSIEDLRVKRQNSANVISA
jgi:hypothetical protein